MLTLYYGSGSRIETLPFSDACIPPTWKAAA
jgi:hypothetical protein